MRLYELFEPLLTLLCLVLQRLPEFISNSYNLAIIFLLFLAYALFSMLSCRQLNRLFRWLKNLFTATINKYGWLVGSLLILGGLSLFFAFIYLLYSVGTNIINHQFPNSDCCQASSCHSGIVDSEPAPNVVSSSESQQSEGEVEPEETNEIQVGGYSEDIVSQQAVKKTLLSCYFIFYVVLTVHVQECVKSQSGLSLKLNPVILQLYNIYTGLTILCCV